MMYIEELVEKISREANLSYYEKEMLLHDINNLRGKEWKDIVEEHCTKETIALFNNSI